MIGNMMFRGGGAPLAKWGMGAGAGADPAIQKQAMIGSLLGGRGQMPLAAPRNMMFRGGFGQGTPLMADVTPGGALPFGNMAVRRGGMAPNMAVRTR